MTNEDFSDKCLPVSNMKACMFGRTCRRFVPFEVHRVPPFTTCKDAESSKAGRGSPEAKELRRCLI